MTRKYGGTGSTFHFSLRAPAIEAQRPAYLTAQQSRLKGKRVLVVTGMVYVGDMGNRRIQIIRAIKSSTPRMPLTR